MINEEFMHFESLKMNFGSYTWRVGIPCLLNHNLVLSILKSINSTIKILIIYIWKFNIIEWKLIPISKKMEELGAWCDSIPHFNGTTDHLCEYQVISQTLLILVCMIGFVGNGLSIPVIVQHLRHISKMR